MVTSKEGRHDLLGTYCGSKFPPALMSTNHGLDVVFVSRRRPVTSSSQPRGFNATFSFVTSTRIVDFCRRFKDNKYLLISVSLKVFPFVGKITQKVVDEFSVTLNQISPGLRELIEFSSIRAQGGSSRYSGW